MTKEEIKQEIIAIDKATKKYSVGKIDSIFKLLAKIEGYEEFNDYVVMYWPISMVTHEEWEHELFINYPRKGKTLYFFNSLKEIADFAIRMIN